MFICDLCYERFHVMAFQSPIYTYYFVRGVVYKTIYTTIREMKDSEDEPFVANDYPTEKLHEDYTRMESTQEFKNILEELVSEQRIIKENKKIKFNIYKYLVVDKSVDVKFVCRDTTCDCCERSISRQELTLYIWWIDVDECYNVCTKYSECCPKCCFTGIYAVYVFDSPFMKVLSLKWWMYHLASPL